MRSGILTCLAVVVLCACATAAMPPAQISPGDILIVSAGDPNLPIGGDPNFTWDVPLHLTVDWEYVSANMSSQIYNPAVRPDAQVQGPQWSLSVVSTVNIIDRDGLVAWSTSPTWAKAYDQDGLVVAGMERSGTFSRWYRQPESWNSSLFSDRFHVSLPIDPSAAYPDVLSKVEWAVNVLVVEKTETIDLAFEPNDTWVELTPGFEIMVEAAAAEEGKYQYRLKTQYDSTKVGNLMAGSVHLWDDESLPPVAILSMAILNADGRSVREVSGGNGGFSSGSGASGSRTQMSGSMSGSGSCSACGDAATIRFTLGFNLHEQEASFTLTDIPVPAF